jgi:hypothetical protein
MHLLEKEGLCFYCGGSVISFGKMIGGMQDEKVKNH